MKKNTIYISLDAGFSGNKIIVNKHIYDIPFAIQDITDAEERYELRRIDSSYVKCIKDERTYLLGQVAKEYMLDNTRDKTKKATVEAFATMERYGMPLFEIALQAFIAYGLHRYSLDSRKTDEPFLANEIGEWDIFVAVALPHQHLAELVPVVKAYLDKGIDISIAIERDTPVTYTFKPSGSVFNSQVISMFINESLTDDLEDVEGENDIYSMLPALVLDGGYKTLGKFVLAADQSVTGDDSDTNYAMLNINEKVVDEINSYRPGFSEYQIDELCSRNEVIRYIAPDSGKVEELNVSKIKKKYLEETSSSLIKELCEEYNDLLDIKCILIGGGTGDQYYPYIKEFCEKHRPHLANHVILAGSNKFYGQECGPVHAIAAGLYKEMLSTFDE